VLSQVLEIHDLLDSAQVDGEAVASLFQKRGLTDVQVQTVFGTGGSTDFVKAVVPGADSQAPVLGIIGRLGGIGARPTQIGLVSDADGAITALSCALKLADMVARGDRLPGDVIVTTHIYPRSPIIPHDPVPFMGAPVDLQVMNCYEVDERMSAILSIDTTRGNWVINQQGFALSPTVKEGYILPVSPDLLHIMTRVTGRPPVTFPLATQDITPYGNGLDHLNSIMQPAIATSAPVVGVAITSELPVAGSATGVCHEVDVEQAARFCIEVAKDYGARRCQLFKPAEFERLLALYGPMTHLQTKGR